MNVIQAPGKQNASKQHDRYGNAQSEGPRHLSRGLNFFFSRAQHKEQCRPEASKNGQKCKGYKVCHEQDYLVIGRFKFVVITLATVLAVASTVGMGVWQLSRAAEKQARQARMDAQDAKPPLNAADFFAAKDPTSMLHRRARLRGTWAAPSLLFLENRPMDGRVGFLVLMPFVLEAGQGTLVVQRGWVPRSLDDRQRVPPVDTPVGVVEIEGRIALAPSDLFVLGTPQGGPIRQNLDLPQWRVETGLPLAPVTLQQTGFDPGGMSRDWPTVSLGVEKNYGYAFQWFGMAFLFVALYIWFQVFRRFIFHRKDPIKHA
jgi:surfeit locus 1 family protein